MLWHYRRPCARSRPSTPGRSTTPRPGSPVPGGGWDARADRPPFRLASNAGYELLGRLVEERAEMPFATYVHGAVLEPLGMAGTNVAGSPAWGGSGPLRDLLAFARQLLHPAFIAPETLAEATEVAFPGLVGVLPGFGRMEPNDWGLGFELKDGKRPHWTGERNSPRTFGHFGRSGAFLWVDPDAGIALACLTDRELGDWAKAAWPHLSSAVLVEFRS